MKHTCHLIVRPAHAGSASGDRLLAVRAGSHVALPVIQLTAKHRVSFEAARATARIAGTCTVVNVGITRVQDDGDTVDTAVSLVASNGVTPRAPYEWVPEEAFTTRPLVPFQRDALDWERRDGDARSRDGIASQEWWARAEDWLRKQLARIGKRPSSKPWIQYRVTPDRVVMACETDAGDDVFLRWTSARGFWEARLAAWLAAYHAPYVAPVFAIDHDRHLWLSGRARGRPASHGLDTPSLEAVMRRLACFQRHMLARAGDLQRLGLRTIDWPDVEDEICGLLAAAQRAGQLTARALVLDRAEIRRLCSISTYASLPCTWIDTDLALDNIYVDGEGMQFIEFEKSLLGPPHVACEALLASLSDVRPDAAAERAHLRQVYNRCWSGVNAAPNHATLEADAPLVYLLLRMASRARNTQARIEAGALQAPLDVLKARAGMIVHRAIMAA